MPFKYAVYLFSLNHKKINIFFFMSTSLLLPLKKLLTKVGVYATAMFINEINEVQNIIN